MQRTSEARALETRIARCLGINAEAHQPRPRTMTSAVYRRGIYLAEAPTIAARATQIRDMTSSRRWISIGGTISAPTASSWRTRSQPAVISAIRQIGSESTSAMPSPDEYCLAVIMRKMAGGEHRGTLADKAHNWAFAPESLSSASHRKRLPIS